MALISGSLHVAWRDAPHPHPFSSGLPQGLSPRRCRHPGRRPHTACSGTGGTQSRSMPLDAFQAAALRLQGLLVGVGNGEEELERSMLIAAPQELKLLVSLAGTASTKEGFADARANFQAPLSKQGDHIVLAFHPFSSCLCPLATTTPSLRSRSLAFCPSGPHRPHTVPCRS